MGAETSPVNAPSLLQETFWPEMAMLVPFAASAAVEMAVKGSAICTRRTLSFAPHGVRAEKTRRESAWVLYIFQVPKIAGLGLWARIGDNRLERNACPTRAKESV